MPRLDLPVLAAMAGMASEAVVAAAEFAHMPSAALIT
jgi:hypothetical protein